MTSNIEWGHNPDGRAEAPLYRAWAKMLVRASGLPWRIVAALAGISPTSMHQLLFGHNGRPVAWIGSDDARALGATNITSLDYPQPASRPLTTCSSANPSVVTAAPESRPSRPRPLLSYPSPDPTTPNRSNPSCSSWPTAHEDPAQT